MRSMARKVLYSFYIDPAVARTLKRASKAEEIPQSQIVREGLRTWLETHRYMDPKVKGGKRPR